MFLDTKEAINQLSVVRNESTRVLQEVLDKAEQQVPEPVMQDEVAVAYLS